MQCIMAAVWLGIFPDPWYSDTVCVYQSSREELSG